VGILLATHFRERHELPEKLFELGRTNNRARLLHIQTQPQKNAREARAIQNIRVAQKSFN
jgi:hypothetical protein